MERYRPSVRVKNTSGGPRGEEERMDGRLSEGFEEKMGEAVSETGESGMMLHAILFPGGISRENRDKTRSAT